MTTDEAGGDDDRPGDGDLLWHPPPAPARGPRRALTLDAIAGAAVRIADADGLAALSMHRVAGDVGVTKMALYRYVRGKPDLEAIMIDAAVEEPPDLADQPGDWRARMETFAGMVAAVWARHPWLPWVTVGQRLMGPREVGWVEAAMRILETTPLAPAERRWAVSLVFGHIRATQSVDGAGTQPWSGGADVDARLRDLLFAHRDRYPALAAAADADGAGGSPPRGPDGREFGLRCLLDGLQAVMDERTGGRR